MRRRGCKAWERALASVRLRLNQLWQRTLFTLSHRIGFTRVRWERERTALAATTAISNDHALEAESASRKNHAQRKPPYSTSSTASGAPPNAFWASVAAMN